MTQACDRTGVCDRSAAIAINAVLKDKGIIDKVDSSKVVDRRKIRRERIKTHSGLKRKKMRENNLHRQGWHQKGDQGSLSVMWNPHVGENVCMGYSTS
ncbi:hypothetical protein AVEN_18170-1 [Araneus ventricosus]|uniref:Uncharacterized protein n=1 Tax=Araneus ventricosus TaxID=182803 RepID=A0A4Y2AK36_ARAVE|nr:hypothetical protein AVEN_18170-1 [Araneus ventricosus]